MTAPSDDPTAGMEPIRQIAMEMMRRCGTCRWWEQTNPSGGGTWWGLCNWPRLNLPASMSPYNRSMHEDAGADCATWKDRADGE